MKPQVVRIYLIIGFICVLLAANNNVSAQENTFTEDESTEINSENTQTEYALPAEENNTAIKPPEYVKGQLIVKLKKDYTLTDIQDLIDKYNVSSEEKVFSETSPEDTLTGLKQKLNELNAGHDRWYWQLEKDSPEYKDYMAKIEKEKKDLNEKITIQEEILADEKQETATEDTHALNMENVFVQNVPPDTNILQMADDYRRNPAVEYAEPNFVQGKNTSEN